MPPSHLIIVCGHAIWLGGPANGFDEAEWLIEAYKKGETPTFIEHIKSGLQLLSQDEDSVLVFSGGPTRKETPLSEAQSYHNLALANAYFGLLPLPRSTDFVASGRILLEPRALDSYHNVLYSLLLFWSRHAAWPARLTLVSHGFKRARLVDGHCAAIYGSVGPPLLGGRVGFVGVDPPGMGINMDVGRDGGGGGEGGGGGSETTPGGSGVKTEAMRGVQLALGQWADDPHGVGEELAGKRRARNCWGVGQWLFESEEERVRSGVEVRVMEDGSEALVEGGRRPWAWA